MKNYDVIVVGGGFAGVAAAISAARGGAGVLLCERTGALGGAASNCLVNPFMRNWTTVDGKRLIFQRVFSFKYSMKWSVGELCGRRPFLRRS